MGDANTLSISPAAFIDASSWYILKRELLIQSELPDILPLRIVYIFGVEKLPLTPEMPVGTDNDAEILTDPVSTDSWRYSNDTVPFTDVAADAVVDEIS